MKLPSTPYTVSCGSANPWSGNTPSVLPNGLWQSITMSIVKVKPFADCTEDEIADIVNGYYDGTLSLADIQSVWSVGDTRTIHLNAIAGNWNTDKTGELQPEQDIQITILGFDHDELTTPINGKTKSLLTLQTVPCLASKGYINSTFFNTNGWNGCHRRTWCNNNFYSSLSTILKSIIKYVNKTSTLGDGNVNLTTSSDKVFLLSVYEVFGVKGTSVAIEGSEYTYYKEGANPIKIINNGATITYWLRSPQVGAGRFCTVFTTGNPDHDPANYDQYGIAPAFCL